MWSDKSDESCSHRPVWMLDIVCALMSVCVSCIRRQETCGLDGGADKHGDLRGPSLDAYMACYLREQSQAAGGHTIRPYRKDRQDHLT